MDREEKLRAAKEKVTCLDTQVTFSLFILFILSIISSYLLWNIMTSLYVSQLILAEKVSKETSSR